MKFMLQVYMGSAVAEYSKLSAAEQQAVDEEYRAISRSSGVVEGNRLQPPSTAATVRVSEGETISTDRPFARAVEPLGGYYLLEATDRDGAIELASRIPAARMGGVVEVRAVVE